MSKKFKILFGLEQQGHIETIKDYFDKHPVRTIENEGKEIIINPLFYKHHWDEIGRIIGWCPFTACLEYFKYESKPPEATQ